MTHALITGGAGFIGTHLARRLLQDGVEVTLVDNLQRGRRDATLEELLQNPLAHFASCDLLDAAALAALQGSFSHVFHLAAIVGVQNVIGNPLQVLTTNVQLHQNMLNWSRARQGLERFVFASTSEVYAGTLEHYGLTFPTLETTPLALPDLQRPRTSYMLSKIYGEAMCWQSGLPCTVVRPHNIYGPRMGVQHVIPELMLRILRLGADQPLEVFSADHQRTFCYVDDAVETLTRLAFSADGKGVFNIGNEQPEISIRELALLVASVLGKTVRLAEGAVTSGSPTRRCPSIAAVRETIGFEPQISLEDGIRRTWEWYRQHVFNGTEGVSTV